MKNEFERKMNFVIYTKFSQHLTDGRFMFFFFFGANFVLRPRQIYVRYLDTEINNQKMIFTFHFNNFYSLVYLY